MSEWRLLFGDAPAVYASDPRGAKLGELATMIAAAYNPHLTCAVACACDVDLQELRAIVWTLEAEMAGYMQRNFLCWLAETA